MTKPTEREEKIAQSCIMLTDSGIDGGSTEACFAQALAEYREELADVAENYDNIDETVNRWCECEEYCHCGDSGYHTSTIANAIKQEAEKLRGE